MKEHGRQSGDYDDLSPDQLTALVTIIGAAHAIVAEEHEAIAQQPNDFQNLYKVLHEYHLLLSSAWAMKKKMKLVPDLSIIKQDGVIGNTSGSYPEDI